MVRENTEDLYQGIEFERGSPEAAALRERLKELGGFDVREDAGITLKPISVTGTRRIVRFAFEYVRANRRRKITVGHKANVMRYSDGLFLRTAEEESARLPRRGLGGHPDRPPVGPPRAATDRLRRPAPAEPLRRHPQRPVRGPRRRARPDPGRQHRLGVRGVRARPRQRAGHRRPGPREPDRDDPLRSDAAAPPRTASRPPRTWSGRSTRSSAAARCAPPTWAATRPRCGSPRRSPLAVTAWEHGPS